MNVTRIAAALRLLADAIETPAASADIAAAPASAPAATSTAPAGAKRGPGRPPKADAPSTTTSAAATAAPAAPTTATAAAAATPAAGASNLTHAVVANDFKAAAAKHGRDFVKNLMTAYSAPTFDKVPLDKLGEFQAKLKAGPQAPPAGPADDLLG